MKIDFINYSILGLIGLILLISFLYNYRDFDYYLEKVFSAENDEDKVEYINKAINAWKESDGKTKKALVYFHLGAVYLMKNQYKKSIMEFDNALKLEPNLTEAYLARGSSYLILQKTEKALEDFTKALKIDPLNPNALLSMAQAYHSKKEYEKALLFFNKAMLYCFPEDHAQILRSKGRLFLEMGLPGQAIKAFRKSYELKKDPYTALLSIIAGSEISDEEYKKEIKKLKKVRPGNKWEATLIKFYQGNITEATLFAEAEKAQKPKQIRERLCEAYYYSGKMAQFKGDKKKAKEYMKLTLKQNIPEFIETGLAEAELERNP